MLFVFYQHKYETYQDELDNKKLILSNAIKQLDQQIKHDENEKNKQKEELRNLQTITTQNPGIGKQIYQTSLPHRLPVMTALQAKQHKAGMKSVSSSKRYLHLFQFLK